MGSNKKTSWGSSNLVIVKDYNTRFNEVIVGNPELSIEAPTTEGGSPVISIDTWYKLQCDETARWKYVGMDYTTAKSCELSLLSGLTFSIPTWDYGVYVENHQLLFGYHTNGSAPQLNSNVSIEKCGDCDMYNVVVDANVTSETFSKNPNLYSSRANYLRNYLNSLSGWSSYPSGWSNGRQQTSASATNIVITQSPTVTRKFNLVGFDIMNLTLDDLSNLTFPAWYKYTDTYTCQLKYTGMTRNACTTLFSSLNSTNGWYYPNHPWEFKYDSTHSSFDWEEKSSVTTYQCLNDFRATKSDSNMWTAELNLCVEKVGYVKNTSSAPSFSWPSIWSSIPGLSQFL